MRGASIGALGLALALAAGPAHAANEEHVRTPVLWPSECGRVVERAVEPTLTLTYDIPVEDLELEDDELPDSRTHQFLAFCRQHPYTELLPPWITRSDVERSVDAGLIEPDSVTYREILDESTIWTDCFTRITPDQPRRPISFEVAEAGVVWDTTSLATGVWSVSGYTFEPHLNLWSDRPGFIKILDDRNDPDQDLPALGLVGTEQVVEVHDPLVFEACADFVGPGLVEFEWAALAPSLDWQPLASVELAEDETWTPELRAPEAAAGLEILLRGRLTDALGRSYEAHAPTRASVMACPDGGCPPPPSADPEPPDSRGAAEGCHLGGDSDPGALPLMVLLGVMGLRMWPKLGRRRSFVG